MTFSRRRFFRVSVQLLLLGFLLGTAWNILHDPEAQGDVRVRHYAVRTWLAGSNPYAPADLAKTAGHDITLAYIYPPDTLPFFAALHASTDLDTARGINLGWQLLLLAALLACWRRWFLEPGEGGNPVLLAFCLVGLGGTLLIDLRVGNISLLEQLLLWLGLAAWVRGRYTLFAVLLWLAASFKLTLLAFSVLLLLPPARQPLKFALVWAAMAARLGLDYVFSPRLFTDFVYALTGGFGGIHELADNNPCFFELVKTLLRLFDGDITDDELLVGALPVCAAVGAIVLGVSWWGWRAICRRWPEGVERRWRLICLLCFAYTLTVPRMKDYSYILLLLPVWRTFQRTLVHQPQAWLGLVVLACLSNRSAIYPMQVTYTFLWTFWPLMAALAAWVFLLNEALGKAGETPAAAASP